MTRSSFDGATGDRADALSRNAPSGSPQSMKSIVLYSSDPDFCFSFMLLFQDRYHIVTTSDPERLTVAVDEYRADLLIVDAVANERISNRFDEIKRAHPALPIILFYVSRLNSPALKEGLLKSVDAVFSKPIDLNTVTRRINELVMKD